MAGFMVWTKNNIRGTGKVIITYIGFYVLEGIILMVEKGILGSALIKKCRYWKKGGPAEEIIWNMQQKEVGNVY